MFRQGEISVWSLCTHTRTHTHTHTHTPICVCMNTHTNILLHFYGFRQTYQHLHTGTQRVRDFADFIQGANISALINSFNMSPHAYVWGSIVLWEGILHHFTIMRGPTKGREHQHMYLSRDLRRLKRIGMHRFPVEAPLPPFTLPEPPWCVTGVSNYNNLGATGLRWSSASLPIGKTFCDQ